MTLRDKIAHTICENRAVDNWLVQARDYELSDAILSVIAESVELVWVDCEPDPLFGISSRADCIFPGDYETYIIYDDSACDDCPVVDNGGKFWFEGDTHYETLKAAKAAAQEDYTRRILSAFGLVDHTTNAS